MTNLFRAAQASLLLVAVSSLTAEASPITSPPDTIIASGDVTAIYAFASASDTSRLGLIGQPQFQKIFCNHTFNSCVQSVLGSAVDLGLQNGLLVFSLDNLTQGSNYSSAQPDASGDYHVKISADFSSFNVGSLPALSASTIDSLVLSDGPVTYIGWEDKNSAQDSDFDYNDLIFAFTNLSLQSPQADVPEPWTILMFGTGISALVLLRRRKEKRLAE
jgi:hypothetical protein